jgi:hypothetical protein
MYLVWNGDYRDSPTEIHNILKFSHRLSTLYIQTIITSFYATVNDIASANIGRCLRYAAVKCSGFYFMKYFAS